MNHPVIVQGFHKRMVRFKACTGENLVWGKEQNVFYFTEKIKKFQMGFLTFNR